MRNLGFEFYVLTYMLRKNDIDWGNKALTIYLFIGISNLFHPPLIPSLRETRTLSPAGGGVGGGPMLSK
jgi:hypothetical protein